jgi:outer membrane lipoprotein-sorting protein
MLKYRLLFFLIFIAGVNLSAQSFKPALNPSKILDELRKASQAVTSVEADFREEKYLAVLKNPEQSSGVFYYKKNDRMRWEQQKPTKYTIVINGDKLRVGEAGKEKNVAAAGRTASQIKELMMGLVNGDFQQNKAFAQTVNENADQYQVVLTPVSNRLKKVYSKIQLVFPKSSLRLRELTFFEKGGDKSVMIFSNEKVNQQIQESVFLNL